MADQMQWPPPEWAGVPPALETLTLQLLATQLLNGAPLPADAAGQQRLMQQARDRVLASAPQARVQMVRAADAQARRQQHQMALQQQRMQQQRLQQQQSEEWRQLQQQAKQPLQPPPLQTPSLAPGGGGGGGQFGQGAGDWRQMLGMQQTPPQGVAAVAGGADSAAAALWSMSLGPPGGGVGLAQLEHGMRLSSEITTMVAGLLPPASEMAARAELLRRLQALTRSRWKSSEVLVFGSSGNGFCFQGADVDLVLRIAREELLYAPHHKGNGPKPAARESTTEWVIEQLGKLLKRNNAVDLKVLSHARVPICKFVDAKTKLQCDICANNPLGLVNTALLRLYADFDPRVQQLGLIVKLWGKRRGINSPYYGTLSSYAFVLMLVHYLQACEPPVLPCAQAVGRDKRPPAIVDGFDVYYCDDCDALRRHMAERHEPNKSTVGELLTGFFLYWARFDRESRVASVRLGATFGKKEKNWHLQPKPRPKKGAKQKGAKKTPAPQPLEGPAGLGTPHDWHTMCIEDPFDTSHDVGRVMDKDTVMDVLRELERAYTMLSQRAPLDAVLQVFR